MLTTIIVIILFMTLVLLHEWGHFIVAKRNGVEVDEFGIGFPPRVWGYKWHGTLYSINLLPLGGFCRMKGEDSGGRAKGTFGAASFWAKTKILLAGVGMNTLMALVIFYVLCVTSLPALGAPFEPTFLHASFAQPKQLILTDVVAGSPADKVGLKRNDYILAANGQKLETNDQLGAFTKAHAGQTVTLRVKKNGREQSLAVKLRAAGKSGALGVVGQQVYALKYDPLSAIVAALYITGALMLMTIWGVVQLIISIPALVMGVFAPGVPASAEAASGPVGIFFIMSNLGGLGASYLWLFVANVSVALAAFNVLPLPALDGGRLAVATWRRLGGRGMSDEAEARYHTVGFFALMVLIVLITVFDVRKYF
jgi:regulator of sigma E protease